MAVVGIHAGQMYRRAGSKCLEDEGTGLVRLRRKQRDGGGEEVEQCEDEDRTHHFLDGMMRCDFWLMIEVDNGGESKFFVNMTAVYISYSAVANGSCT